MLYGPPGTGKTYRAMGLANELASRQAFRKRYVDLTASERERIQADNGLVRICSFHPGWGYEDFMEGLKPKLVNGQLSFEARDGVFKQLCLAARQCADLHYFLVIDEINRGDISRVFGELLTVIEMDKRERYVRLPVTGEQFSVPLNVFLVGTMNTADRSISLIDAALRRRFGFIELMPDSSAIGSISVGDLLLGPWLDALNTRLRRYLKRDTRNLQIGHAYLLTKPSITSVVEFSRILRDDIIPLLEEYCYDDFEMLKEILGPDLIDTDRGRVRQELFDAGREDDLIKSVSFEEMRPLVVNQDPPDASNPQEGQEGDEDDGDF